MRFNDKWRHNRDHSDWFGVCIVSAYLPFHRATNSRAATNCAKTAARVCALKRLTAETSAAYALFETELLEPFAEPVSRANSNLPAKTCADAFPQHSRR